MDLKIINFKSKIMTLIVGITTFIGSFLVIALLFRIPFIHGLYESLESYIYFQLTFKSTAEPTKHIIIIDEETNKYTRNEYARLISGLDRRGVKVIALDVLFEGTESPEIDNELVLATQASSDKIIHAFEFINYDNKPIIPDQFHINLTEHDCENNFLENILGVILPFKSLLDVTTNLAFVTAGSDVAYRDNQYFPMIIRFNDRIYASLPLLTVLKFLDLPNNLTFNNECDLIELEESTENLTIPIDSRSQTLINFIIPNKFSGKRFSVEQALTFIEDPQSTFLKDKIVLIGNSKDSQEQSNAPHFRTIPNIFIYAGVISQILNQQNIKDGAFENIKINFILVVLAIFWIIFFADKFNRVKTWHIFIGILAVQIIIAYIAINLGIKNHVFLPYIIFITSYVISNNYYAKNKAPNFGTKKRIIYEDYYILIGPKRKKENTYPVFLIDCPAGEDFCEMKFLISEREMNKIRTEMSQNFYLEVQALKKFGANLFQALFQPEIRDQFDRSLGMVNTKKNVNLRIKLRVDAPDLAHYPWEYMYDSTQINEYLALHKDISITRFLPIPEPVPTIQLKPPLRILVIISNPDHAPFSKLNVENEKKLIKKSLLKLERQGYVKLSFMKRATFKDLGKALKKGIDIIHFIGHGGYSKELGGCLVFEDTTKGYDLVNIDRIGKLLEDKALRLVVLNACQTAEISDSEICLGVAEGLVKIGIPAVIAMQFSVPDESAIQFSKEFYTTLAETFQVDRAVAEARKKLFLNLDTGRIDWGIPVLFMRKDDGIIFDLNNKGNSSAH